MPSPSFDEVRRKEEEERAAYKAQIEKNAKWALASLRKDGFTRVVVDYDGHNDEGFITRVVMVAADGKETELTGRELTNQMYQPRAPGSSELVPAPTSPMGALADFVMKLVDDEHPGYENNEGGFGTCVIDVATGEYDLNHTWGYGKPYELRNW